MAFYKITDPNIIAKVKFSRDMRLEKINQMVALAHKLGFETMAYVDHREIGLWLAGFISDNPETVDTNKWKSFTRKDGILQFSPKKSNKKFYKEIKDEYEALSKTCFHYESQLKLLAGVNWLAVKDIYFADNAIYFSTDLLLTNEKPDYVVEILSDEFSKIKKEIFKLKY